jgi:hypothetical protein
VLGGRYAFLMREATTSISESLELNPLPSLTLRSPRDLNVPCRPKGSKELSLAIKNGLSLKKKIYLHFEQKHLIPFKILPIGGNTLVQSVFPLCETSLEMLKLDVVECLLRSCTKVRKSRSVLPAVMMSLSRHLYVHKHDPSIHSEMGHGDSSWNVMRAQSRLK